MTAAALVNLAHWRASARAAARGALTAAGRESRDLIGLLIAHGARVRRSAQPTARVSVSGAGVTIGEAYAAL